MDWADSPAARCEFDFDEIDRRLGTPAPANSTLRPLQPTKFGKPSQLGCDPNDPLELIRFLLSFILSLPKCRLTCECIKIATGDGGVEGLTMTKLALKHNVTRAAVSKRNRMIREALNLPRNGFNKTASASRVYARTNFSLRRLGDD